MSQARSSPPPLGLPGAGGAEGNDAAGTKDPEPMPAALSARDHIKMNLSAVGGSLFSLNPFTGAATPRPATEARGNGNAAPAPATGGDLAEEKASEPSRRPVVSPLNLSAMSAGVELENGPVTRAFAVWCSCLWLCVLEEGGACVRREQTPTHTHMHTDCTRTRCSTHAKAPSECPCCRACCCRHCRVRSHACAHILPSHMRLTSCPPTCD